MQIQLQKSYYCGKNLTQLETPLKSEEKFKIWILENNINSKKKEETKRVIRDDDDGGGGERKVMKDLKK